VAGGSIKEEEEKKSAADFTVFGPGFKTNILNT
jgi:hypothetical protein